MEQGARMKLLLCCLLLYPALLFAVEVDLVGLDGKRYARCLVLDSTPSTVKFVHAGGTATVRFAELDASSRQRLARLGYRDEPATATPVPTGRVDLRRDVPAQAERRQRLRIRAEQLAKQATTEDQLKVALLRRFVAEQKTDHLTLAKYSSLDAPTQLAVQLYGMDLLPDELLK